MPIYKCQIEFHSSGSVYGGRDVSGVVIGFPGRVPCIGEQFLYGDFFYRIKEVFWFAKAKPDIVAILSVETSGLN